MTALINIILIKGRKQTCRHRPPLPEAPFRILRGAGGPIGKGKRSGVPRLVAQRKRIRIAKLARFPATPNDDGGDDGDDADDDNDDDDDDDADHAENCASIHKIVHPCLEATLR